MAFIFSEPITNERWNVLAVLPIVLRWQDINSCCQDVRIRKKVTFPLLGELVINAKAIPSTR